MAKYLIIGASSGIGKATATLLADQGHEITGTYHSNTEYESLPNYHALNVMEDTVDLSFVGDHIDGLVYCPGSITLKPFHRIKPTQFREDFELQVLGAVKTIQAALPLLKKSDHPSIVLFSTIAVQLGFNFHSLVSTSKGAIEGLTKALAAELAPSIRVNCIAPSLTQTPLAGKLLNTDAKIEANANNHPLKRIGQAEDIAHTVAYLLTPQSSWMTGQIIHLDGGLSTLKM